MLGLILKDFYSIRRRYLIFIGFMLFYALLFNGRQSSMLMLLLAALSMVYSSLELIKNEERFHWFSYILATPISRTTLVAERFIFSIINLTVAMPLTALIIHFLAPFGITEPVSVNLVLTLYGAVLIYNAFLLFISLIFCTDVARYATMAVLAVIFLIGKFSENIIAFLGIDKFQKIVFIEHYSGVLLIVAAIIVNLIAYFFVKRVIVRRDY